MREVLPGIHHWTAVHPDIRHEVSSHWLPELGGGVLLDPLLPAEGLDPFRERPPREILLTNHYHYRQADLFAGAFGCTIRCPRAGAGKLPPGRRAEPYDFGDRLAGGIEAVEIGCISPEETALHIPLAGGVMAVADGLIRADGVIVDGDGGLSFLPDEYMGKEDAGNIREGLRAALPRLLERDFDHMLFAHGHPWIGGAREALRRFLEG